MLKRIIEHVQGITFDVEYTVELQDAEEVLKFKCYAPDGIRYKWVHRTADTSSWTVMDQEYDIRHFALGIYEIDDVPVCKYLRDEMGKTLPDVLDNVSDNPHEWVWSESHKENQVGLIADAVYDVLSKLPNELQETLSKMFRALLSQALGVTHIKDELDRIEDLTKILQHQAREEEEQRRVQTPTPVPSNKSDPEPIKDAGQKDDDVPPGMERNEHANEKSSFFVPPHKSTREHQLAEQDRKRAEEKKEIPPEVAAAMAYTEKAMKE